MYRFDPITLQVIWTMTVDEVIQSGEINFGDSGDLSIDTGLRDNDSSTLDQGDRV